MNSNLAQSSENVFYYIIEDISKLPEDIIEDDEIIIRSMFDYRKVPPLFFKARLKEDFIGEICLVALKNPTDEFRTYLALLGFRTILEDVTETYIPIQELYEAAEYITVSREF